MLSVFLRNFQARKSFCRMLVLLLLRIGFGAWPPLSASEGDTLALPYVWNFSSLESLKMNGLFLMQTGMLRHGHGRIGYRDLTAGWEECSAVFLPGGMMIG